MQMVHHGTPAGLENLKEKSSHIRLTPKVMQHKYCTTSAIRLENPENKTTRLKQWAVGTLHYTNGRCWWGHTAHWSSLTSRWVDGFTVLSWMTRKSANLCKSGDHIVCWQAIIWWYYWQNAERPKTKPIKMSLNLAPMSLGFKAFSGPVYSWRCWAPPGTWHGPRTASVFASLLPNRPRVRPGSNDVCPSFAADRRFSTKQRQGTKWWISVPFCSYRN